MKNLYLLFLTGILFSFSIPAKTTGTAHNNDRRLWDFTAPAISYPPLINSGCLTGRTLTAVITDADGVNGTSGTRPRLYYKRSTDPNQWNNNSSLSTGWKFVEATNNSSPFNFNIDYSLLFLGTGVNAGNTVQYFVVAQDMSATPNVAVSSGAFSVTPFSVALTGAAFPINGTINSFNIVPALATTLTVGLLGNYTSLTGPSGLFNAINTYGLSGNTTVNITDLVVLETGDVALNQLVSAGCSAGNYTLTIKPSGLATVLTGNYDGTLLRILSSNVTIDGSSNGSNSRNLLVTNINLASPSVILFGSTGTTPITNSGLKNTTIVNGLNTVNPVVISDGDNPGDAGYFNNITIRNNSVQTGYLGIFCNAVPVAGNGSVLITENDMNTLGVNSIRLVPIYAQGVDGAVFSNNNVGNILNTADANITGIWLAMGCTNCSVTGNNIANINGTIGAARGIVISSNEPASNITISKNTINGIYTASAGVASGILVLGNSGGVKIHDNNINLIRNTNSSNSGCNGIQLSAGLTAAATSVYNNFIYDVAGFGKAGAGVADNGYGIIVTAGAGYNIDHNTINLNTDQTVSSGSPAAINIGAGVSVAGTINLRNNIFANSQGILSGLNTRYAIYSAAPNAAFGTIDYNDYYSAGTNVGNIANTNRANLADVQTGFGGNSYSTTVKPNFVSAADLHLQPGNNCRLDGYGMPVGTITADYDNELRNAITPDIGADEFTTLPVVTGMATASACDSKRVLPTGSFFIDGSCRRIVKVLPSGSDPVTGNIATCVTLDAVTHYFNGQPYVKRHYDIEPASGNQTTTSATITLYFADAEFVAYNSNNPAWPPLPTLVGGGNIDPNRANVKITQFHGVSNTSPSGPDNYPGVRVLVVPGASNVYWNGSFWEVTFNITGFSGFYVHTNGFNQPLPVLVNYLNGRKQGSDHLLNWKVTCAGTPRAIMTLERSADGRNFAAINTVTADAARCQQPFGYTAASPLKGMNYYRLKITDGDGHITYSTTVALLNAAKGFDIVSIAPNPVVTDDCKLHVASARAGNMDIAIFDMQGRLVKRQSIPLIAGFNSLPVNVANLSPGTYSIRANVAGDPPEMIRFVKQ